MDERRASGSMKGWHGAVVVALYGPAPADLWERLQGYSLSGLCVVAVNNNNDGDGNRPPLDKILFIDNANIGGLAGGLNRGVAVAISEGIQAITLLDQDSELSSEAILALQQRVQSQPNAIFGPPVWDKDFQQWHTPPGSRPRLMITSGTSFSATTWHQVGEYLNWMEIDYIDHEWCSRARRLGLTFRVLPAAELQLKQQFGQHHPHPLAHQLGMRLYSQYRRAVAVRNLRWMVWQTHVPLDIRLKEVVKMAIKPWFWLALEPNRSSTMRALLVGLQAPLGEPFPIARLKGMES